MRWLARVAKPKVEAPVATVAIDNAINAGLLALQILATADTDLQQQLLDYRDKMRDELLEKLEEFESEWKSR